MALPKNEMHAVDPRLQLFRDVLFRIPPQHYNTLRTIVLFFLRVLQENTDKINSSGLGVIFGPTMLFSEDPVVLDGPLVATAMLDVGIALWPRPLGMEFNADSLSIVNFLVDALESTDEFGREHIKEEGVIRLSGTQTKTTKAVELFSKFGPKKEFLADLVTHDIVDVLKKFIRQHRGGLILPELQGRFLQASSAPGMSYRLICNKNGV